MARFVWYLVDIDVGIVTGSNDTDKVKELLEQDEAIIAIHKDSGIALMNSDTFNQIEVVEHDFGDEEEEEGDD